MNENIQSWIIEQANNITNWVGAEIPSFIQEFLTWNSYNGLINISICLIGLGIILGLCLKFKKQINEIFKYNEALMIPIVCVGLPVIILLNLFLFDNIKEVVQIKVAPKVYLVEKAAKMIKDK